MPYDLVHLLSARRILGLVTDPLGDLGRDLDRDLATVLLGYLDTSLLRDLLAYLPWNLFTDFLRGFSWDLLAVLSRDGPALLGRLLYRDLVTSPLAV